MSEHEKHMNSALAEAKRALEKGDFPVGCVIVGKNGVVASGRREHSFDKPNELDHAEIVALRNLLESGHGTDTEELVAYSTMEPCLMCFSTLLLNNIRTIVYAYEDVMGGGTGLRLNDLPPLYASLEVTVISHVLRKESLQLFQQFFRDPDTPYWNDSLLSRYTLAQ